MQLAKCFNNQKEKKQVKNSENTWTCRMSGKRQNMWKVLSTDILSRP